MLVLLVEDDPDLAELVFEYLESESIQCDMAFHGQMALNLIEQNHYDIIVSDVMMPILDGFSLVKTLREKGISTPLIMLTAKDQLQDKLEGFSVGADDYLVKPFELAELVARIRALESRQSGKQFLLTVRDLSLNTQTKIVSRQNRTLSLSATEWKLLEYLMRNSPQVISKAKIENLIWHDEPPSKDAYKMLIYRLRKSIDSEFEQSLLNTVRGQGISIG
ncbi:MAG: response regulator transcription factor [Kangiellaceae bacterium]|nr:response regulator transcription factor [Kangiellaceae bacterium]MCW9015413.1 response regulator transcription factor [Kangiellaceae bacterium]